MTSVLNVDSIAAKDGTSPVELTKQNAPKAFVNFSMAGTTARDSLNFSSLTDTATGKFNVTMASAFTDTNYTASGYSNGFASAGFAGNQSHGIAVENRISRTTTVYAFDSYIGSYVDSIENRALVLGDLA
jgi:hypothetical protein